MAWRLVFLMLELRLFLLFALEMVCMTVLLITFVMIFLLFMDFSVHLGVAGAVAVSLSVVPCNMRLLYHRILSLD